MPGNAKTNTPVPIEHEGLIESAELGQEWERVDMENNAVRRLVCFYPSGDQSVAISLHENRVPINALAAQAFHDLLSQHAHEMHTLSSSEVISLEHVMNRLNVGDNQHTNPAQQGERYAPVFRLDACRVQQINGKAVLLVNGCFVDPGGTPTTLLEGIFIDCDGTGRRIQGLAFEAPDQNQYDRHQGAFENMLKSICWVSEEANFKF